MHSVMLYQDLQTHACMQAPKADALPSTQGKARAKEIFVQQQQDGWMGPKWYNSILVNEKLDAIRKTHCDTDSVKLLL